MHFNSLVLTILPLLATSSPLPLEPRACAPLELIYARGTTERQASFGLVGTPLVIALQAAVPGISTYNVVYPATSNFQTSAAAGSRDVVRRITETAAACPETKFALAGYSQGAMVIHGIRTSISAPLRSKIASIAVFGDPFRTSRPTLPIDDQTDVIKFCARGDPICQNGINMSAHTSYARNGNVATAATFIASKA